MRVLVVEDERPLSRALAMNMTARGYEVAEAATGSAGLNRMAQGDVDVLVLDLGLPDLSGLEVIRAVRAYGEYGRIPIIVLSARTGSGDKVTALDLGANDYVTKPFNVDELLARIRALTRDLVAVPSGKVQVGLATVDLAATIAVDREGERIHLTPTEWQLLEVLLRHPGKLITSRALLSELRRTPEHTDPSYLRTYVAQLRRKLEPQPDRPRHLITEPGMGYRFQP